MILLVVVVVVVLIYLSKHDFVSCAFDVDSNPAMRAGLVHVSFSLLDMIALVFLLILGIVLLPVLA